MEFRYPKARLFAYNKLAGGDSCYSVMIQAVTDAGLLSEDVAEHLFSEVEHQGNCGSLHAAEAIIRAFMHEKHDSQKAEELSAAAFNQIKSDLNSWQETSKIAQDCKLPESKDACRDMTPVVLDLLLQQVMRH